jgi:RNA polymerase sigma-70 factor (ECF subfamily)
MREEGGLPPLRRKKARTAVQEDQFPDQALRRRIYRRILALVNDAAEAEDLTQETLIRVYRGLPQFRGESSLTTWALRIARNVVQDGHRHAASHPLEMAEPMGEGDFDGLVDPAAPDPEREVERRLSAECIRETLETLPQRYREAVELHDLEGLENPEIAQRLRLPVSTVKIRVHRGRGRLRGACEEDCEPYSDGRGNVVCRPRKPGPA